MSPGGRQGCDSCPVRYRLGGAPREVRLCIRVPGVHIGGVVTIGLSKGADWDSPLEVATYYHAARQRRQ